MKEIFLNIKNLIPYLFLILIYFFFINIEAQKNIKKNPEDYSTYKKNIMDNQPNQKKINIPENPVKLKVIPYKG